MATQADDLLVLQRARAQRRAVAARLTAPLVELRGLVLAQDSLA